MLYVKTWVIYVHLGLTDRSRCDNQDRNIGIGKERVMGLTFQSEANVIALVRARTDMRFPVITEVYAYWDALRNGRPLPLRSEIDPRGIERALENAFVLERIAPGMARFRLAGMHLNDLMGMEVRGMPLTAFFTPKAREEMTRVLEAVFSGPEIVELTLSAEPGIGKPAVEGKLLILPLRSDLGDVTRALGCFATIGAVGRAPRRFEITSVKTTKIRGVEPSAAALAAKPAAQSAQQGGFNEAPAAFAGAAPVPAKRPALRLVKSDE